MLWITDGNVQDSADSTFSFFIGNTTGKKVKVIVADFTQEDVFSEIEEQLKDLNIGVLGWISSIIQKHPLLHQMEAKGHCL